MGGNMRRSLLASIVAVAAFPATFLPAFAQSGLERIKTIPGGSDGVMGSPRIWKELRYVGEPCGRNRVARLMRQQELYGIPQRKRWRKKVCGQRPENVRNHLQRDFTASEPNTRWVTDITYVRNPGKLALSVRGRGPLFGHRGRLVDEPQPGSATGATGRTHGAVAT